jgi:hypothetical protein
MGSRDRLEKSGQAGAQGLPLPLVRFIAFAELCGALGLIQPWATGIVPALTVAAAVGLGVIMILAAVVHTRLREPRPCLPQRLVARLRITPPATTMMSPRPSRRSSASRRGR